MAVADGRLDAMVIVTPIGTDHHLRRAPTATFLLIAANVAVFLATLRPEGGVAAFFQAWGLVPANPTLVTLFTSMFMHAGFFHLLGNMLFLFAFGPAVEDRLGAVRFTALYLAFGAVGGLLHVAIQVLCFPARLAVPAVGASAAICGVMGWFMVAYPRAQVGFAYFVWLFLVYVRYGIFRVSAFWAVAYFAAGDLFWALFTVHTGVQLQVASWAHLGGFLAGAALALVLCDVADDDRADEPTCPRPAFRQIRAADGLAADEAFIARHRTPARRRVA